MSITAMTQNEMVTEVANIIGRDQTSLSADNATLYSDRIKQWLYWSHLTIARIYAFPELDADPVDFVSTIGNNAYTFATMGLARVRQILGITVINGTRSCKTRQKLWRAFEEEFPSPADDPRGQPEYYTIYGRRIELYQVPDLVYTLRIRINQYPDNFASGTSVSPYENKDDVVIAGAVTHAYVSLQENADASAWATIFASRLQAVIGPYQDPQDWEPEGRAFDYNLQRPVQNYHANPLVFFNP
jgi:hypothetical protein